MSEPPAPGLPPVPDPVAHGGWSSGLRLAFAVASVALSAAFVAVALFFDVFGAGRMPLLTLGIAAVFGLPALTGAALSRRRWAKIACAVAWIAVIVLVLTPWHPRKRFVRDLDSVRPGMTVDEVEAILGKYVKGSGWAVPAGPPPPVRGPDDPVDEDAARRASEAQAAYESPAYPAGDARAHATGTMTYRWCTTGAAFNADWGQVTFEDGRVVQVEFLPD